MAARSAISKIEAILSTDLREDVHDLKKRMRFISVLQQSGQEPPELLAQVRRAIIQRKTLEFEYHARVSEAPHLVRKADPYSLVNYDRRWYVRAYDHLRQDVRHFRLERMENVRVLDSEFVPKQDIEPLAESEDERPLTVRALFKPEIARWVREERSFYTVSAEDIPEGLLVTLQVRREEDVMQWLLGWGADVRVLEPASLYERLSEEARQILNQYQFVEV
jgi:predicted DNA-binding transcriptional regulator YafY